MGATFCPVMLGRAVEARSFFYLVSCRLEDVDLHRLPAERALKLSNALERGAQLTRRHHLLVGPDRRLAAALEQDLPLPHQAMRDGELATQLRHRDFATLHARDLLALELGRKAPPSV